MSLENRNVCDHLLLLTLRSRKKCFLVQVYVLLLSFNRSKSFDLSKQIIVFMSLCVPVFVCLYVLYIHKEMVFFLSCQSVSCSLLRRWD